MGYSKSNAQRVKKLDPDKPTLTMKKEFTVQLKKVEKEEQSDPQS